MKHLRGGVKKGAFDESAVQAKFDAWKSEKAAKLDSVRNGVANEKKATYEKNLAEEKKVNEAIAKKVAEKKAAIEAAKASEASEAPAEETSNEAE